MTPADGSTRPLIHARGSNSLPDQAPVPGSPSTNGVHASNALIPLPLTPTTAPAPTLTALVIALKRRWFSATVLALVAAAITVYVVSLFFPPKYVSQARLELTSRGARPLFNSAGEPDVDPAIFRANQTAILKSPLVLSRALNNEKLRGTTVAAQSPDSLEYALKVDFTQGPEIMTVRLLSDVPDYLAVTLEAIVESYIEESRIRDNRRRTLTIAELERTLKGTVKLLQAKRSELVKAEIDNKLPDPAMQGAQLQALSSKLGGRESRLREVQDNLTDKQVRLSEKKALLTTVDTAPIPEHKLNIMFNANLQIQQFHQDYLKLGADINKLKLHPESPLRQAQIQSLTDQQAAIQQDIKDAQETLRPTLAMKYRNELRESLEQEIQNLVETIRQLESQEVSLINQVREVQADIDKLNLVTRKPGVIIDRLRDEVNQIEKSQERLAADLSLLRFEPAISSKIVVLKAPETPTSKDYAQLAKLGTAGGFGVFALVLFGVAFLEFKARKVNAPEEVTEELGLTLVGTMPRLPPRVQRSVHNGTSPQTVQWQSIITESIDAIRTQLLHAARTDAVQVVMVTSAMGGEGKTSLSSQLAASLARAWRKTLLVDGDLRNPAAHKLFRLPLDPGLSELLRGETSVADAVKPTSLSRLWLMPAGHWDAHAVQALAQDGVRAKFDQLKEQYDFIIVDSCPVLPVADSLLLGQHVDAVIFSVLRDVSRLPSVKAAQQKLQGLGVRMLGAVVIGAADTSGSLAYRYPGQAGL